MKKFLAILVALTLMLTAVTAFAAPSKTPGDLVTVDGNDSLIIFFPQDDESIQLAEDEAEKLSDAGVDEYFGKADEIAAILGKGPYEVNEFWTVGVKGANTVDGDVTRVIKFPTPYEADAKVAVLIGLVNGENIAWSVYEGTGTEDGGVEITFDKDILVKIEDGTALLAVVSK